MLKHKIQNIIIPLLITLLLPLPTFAQVDPAFNPNKLIDDKIFNDTQTFGGPEGVQRFLELKNSVLANTSLAFLAKLKEPDATMLKQGLEDPRPNLGRLRTAAELIWDASLQSGLNPQVIIVTLNKEQGLITSANDYNPAKLQKALDRAMGFDCPDGTGCGDLFPGFYYQLFGNYDSGGNRYLGAAKSLMKSFNTPNGRGPNVNGVTSRVGDTVTIENTVGEPYNAPASQIVNIFNRATAALYRYTPHVFNGNYNFWKFFNAWFRYANGTLFSLPGGETYIVQNGSKQLVPAFVAQGRGLNLATKITVSPTEFESYPTDKVFGPVNNTIVKDPDGKTYVFTDNVKHPASNFVITQRGLKPASAITVTASDLALFEQGSVLTPSDGTVIKGQKTPAIYLVENGQLKLFSSFTFAQRKVSLKKVVPVPDDEIATYTRQGFVPPLDGTLAKPDNSPTVYLIENGFKRPVTAEVFKNRGFKKVATISADEINALALGAYATPKEKTYFAVDSKTGSQYIFKDGTKHSISSFVAKQRGITPDYVFPSSVAYEWLDGIPVPPRDNTLVVGDANGTVYLVTKSQLRPLTAAAFKNRRYSFKNVKTLPQAEVDAYAKGEVIEK